MKTGASLTKEKQEPLAPVDLPVPRNEIKFDGVILISTDFQPWMKNNPYNIQCIDLRLVRSIIQNDKKNVVLKTNNEQYFLTNMTDEQFKQLIAMWAKIRTSITMTVTD